MSLSAEPSSGTKSLLSQNIVWFRQNSSIDNQQHLSWDFFFQHLLALGEMSLKWFSQGGSRTKGSIGEVGTPYPASLKSIFFSIAHMIHRFFCISSVWFISISHWTGRYISTLSNHENKSKFMYEIVQLGPKSCFKNWSAGCLKLCDSTQLKLV